MIKIDGAHGEAGGQIARTAMALSTITGKPFEIINIRKGRCNPGLKAQHLHCIKALEELCGAKTQGAILGSSNLTYEPGTIKGKTISINIGTAGSITLLLQALLIPSFFADTKVRLKITGGTDGKWAQPYDYFKNIFVPQIERFVENIEVNLIQRGYYPKGNGLVDSSIVPKFKLKDSNGFEDFLELIRTKELDYNLIECDKLKEINGVSHASNLLKDAKVAERQIKGAKQELIKLNLPIKIRTEYDETLSPGSGIVLWAKYEKSKVAGDSLGEKGKKAEIVGMDAAKNLIKEIESKAPVDKYLADQLLPFLALSKGKIKVSQITNHCKTNMYIIEKFLDIKFKVEGNIISCS